MRRMLRAITSRLTYANVTATLALLFAMTGGALAAHHYLVNSIGQINPKVVKKLKGKKGPRGRTGATGATGAAGAPGAPGKDGSNGGASEIAFKLPASTTPTFSNVGTAQGISLEAKCEWDSKTKTVTLDMTYTSAVRFVLTQTEFTSYNDGPTETANSSFVIHPTSTPAFWVHFSAEEGKTSIERFEGNWEDPKVITSESYVVRGQPAGECEAAIGFTPAS